MMQGRPISVAHKPQAYSRPFCPWTFPVRRRLHIRKMSTQSMFLDLLNLNLRLPKDLSAVTLDDLRWELSWTSHTMHCFLHPKSFSIKTNVWMSDSQGQTKVRQFSRQVQTLIIEHTWVHATYESFLLEINWNLMAFWLICHMTSRGSCYEVCSRWMCIVDIELWEMWMQPMSTI